MRTDITSMRPVTYFCIQDEKAQTCATQLTCPFSSTSNFCYLFNPNHAF